MLLQIPYRVIVNLPQMTDTGHCGKFLPSKNRLGDTHLCILSLAAETAGETVAVVAILFSSQVLAFKMLFLYVSGGI